MFVIAQLGSILYYYKYLFSNNEIFESIGPKQSDFLLVIKKYVHLSSLQTPVFPLKPQKEIYFFLGHPVYFIDFSDHLGIYISSSKCFNF